MLTRIAFTSGCHVTPEIQCVSCGGVRAISCKLSWLAVVVDVSLLWADTVGDIGISCGDLRYRRIVSNSRFTEGSRRVVDGDYRLLKYSCCLGDVLGNLYRADDVVDDRMAG